MESEITFYEDGRWEEIFDATKEWPDAEEGGGDDEWCGNGGDFNFGKREKLALANWSGYLNF